MLGPEVSSDACKILPVIIFKNTLHSSFPFIDSALLSVVSGQQHSFPFAVFALRGCDILICSNLLLIGDIFPSL